MMVKGIDSQAHGHPIARRTLVGSTAAALLVSLGLGLLGGCGKTEPIKYYQLTVPGEGAPAMTQAALPITLIVGRLLTSEIYRDGHLVYALTPQEMGTYEYQRWVESPPLMIQQVFLRQLRATGHYQSVYTPEGKAAGDYLLRGHLYDFKEVDSSSGVTTRVTMQLELRNSKTGETVWTHYYSHDEPATAKTIPEVVASLDKNVQLASSELISGLEQYFAAHPVK